MLRGLDHLVVAVRDLDAAGQALRDLGFTVTPENRHAWGTANRLVQLDGFFIELLSVAEPDKIPRPPTSLFLRCLQPGFPGGTGRRQHAGSGQHGAGRWTGPEFEKAGLQLFEPFSFERLANLADGSTACPSGSTFDLHTPIRWLSPGHRLFHLPQPLSGEFLESRFSAPRQWCDGHPAAVYLVAADPSDHHEFLGGFTGQREMRATSLGLELKTARGRISGADADRV